MGASVKTFYDVLEKIRRESKSTTELGVKFEKITKYFLETDRQYKKRFKKVVLWKDWKYQDGPDTGIDLMAEEQNGDWCAIQCKCYEDYSTLSMGSVSTFFNKATSLAKKHNKIVNLILVFTGDNITGHAERTIEDHTCHVIGQSAFGESSVIWDEFPKLKTRHTKELRHHQKMAFDDVIKGLKAHDRGKMIMACGTGKTLTSLRIAEKYAGTGKTVLYLVPSISLIHQTIREWSENAKIPHYYGIVCSDKSVGIDDDSITELPFPPTTKTEEIQGLFSKKPSRTMGVIFSTYHSIDVAAKALKNKPFDLVLCDEAHRTTGVEQDDKDKTYFSKVHDNKNVKAKKRLYMTATPRVYSEALKAKENVFSMDDTDTYGEDFHNYSFSKAVEDGQLTDFKVRIPIISQEDKERYIDDAVDGSSDEGTIDERALLAAVWHGLNFNGDEKTPLLQRLIAFTNKIEASKQFAGPYTGEIPTMDEKNYLNKLKKKEDEGDIIQDRSFPTSVKTYESKNDDHTGNGATVRHIDGSMRSSIRSTKLRWLKASNENPNECRILSNARCLSEGVDVQALDGVIFLQPRKTVVDVVQSVGRVMRKSEGKDWGYVILPVVIPTGVSIEASLTDKKAWKIVWQVLSALRSHNPDFANEINRINIDRHQGRGPPSDNVEIIWMGHLSGSPESDVLGKITTKMVEKCGDRKYYNDRAEELGKKARDIYEIIKAAHTKKNPRIINTVTHLRDRLQVIINDTINNDATMEIIAQHYALSQIFQVLFEQEFESENPVAQELDRTIRNINLSEELKKFDDFYDGVRKEATKFQTPSGRQNYIKKIYEEFLKGFDKKQQERDGVVYTPVEVIDFIINSVEDVLRTEFDTGFNRNNVKVFDPFTGTGSFIARLLESRLIHDCHILNKFQNDMFANEKSLLAYYVASVNIESVFQRTYGGEHVPFTNINYTDTFRHHPQYRYDKNHRMAEIKLDGDIKTVQDGIRRSKWSHVHVIMTNPPYLMAQGNQDDNTPNLKYPELDNMIKESYVEKVKEINWEIKQTRSLYDSYIRSIRWASNRIGKSGIIGFITNASFIKTEVAAGIRASLREDFTDVWCFDLRGNALTKGDIRKREGGGIFDSGSRAPTTITILVKNPKKEGCTIHYKDIGDYLTREEKLKIIKNKESITGIKDWKIIVPDKHYDWIDQRNPKFSQYMPIVISTSCKKSTDGIFKKSWPGLGTGRDAWAYNSSKKELSKNMKRHIDYCIKHKAKKQKKVKPTDAHWTNDLTKKLKNLQKFDENKIRLALYRPFFKQYLYLDKILNSRPSVAFDILPEPYSKNLIIIVPDNFIGEFSIFVTNAVPDLHIISSNQCFPLFVYKNKSGKKSNISKNIKTDNNKNKKIRKDNITVSILNEYRVYYKNKKITKEHIFEYVYGMLHHPKYRKKFANNLIRELPHIPMAPDFWAFRNVGKELINLHLNYETGTKHDLGDPKFTPKKFTNIAFGKKKIDGKMKITKSVICEGKTTVFENLPETKYRVNGSTPIEWLVDQYKYSKDKESCIVNNLLDAMTGREVIDLIRRLVHVGIESDRLIKSLPAEFEPKNWKPKKTGLDKFTNDNTPSQSTL